MTDACKYCGRTNASSIDEFEEDIDGKADLCGRAVHAPEAAYDCRSHEAHVAKMRLMRAESLLQSASMLHLMDRQYIDRVTAEIREFLSGGQTVIAKAFRSEGGG